MPPLTRFAPSPTGWLHPGHALSALEVWRTAREIDAEVRLRIEDIDHTRCRPEYDAAILNDLAWLGLRWSGPVWRQSERLNTYREVLDGLRARGLVYPCFCTRADIRAAAAETGFEGPVYPGTCRAIHADEAGRRIAGGEAAAWRLKLDAAMDLAGPIAWRDMDAGEQHWDGQGWGDVVLARKDIGTSYHLAVTIDDAAQGITHVIRGQDLFEATHFHVLLQRLLDLPTPLYRHHRLLVLADGRKLSKRDGAAGLREIAGAGHGPGALFDMLRENGFGSTIFDGLGTVTGRSDE